MKILYFLGEFPKISETFILNQITGLIDLGNDVYIIAQKGDFNNKIHLDVLRYHLLNKTEYYGKGKNKFSKIIRFMILLTKYYLRIFFQIDKHPKLKLKEIMEYPSLILLVNTLSKHHKTETEFNIILAHFGMNGVLAKKLIERKYLSGNLFTAFHGSDITKYLNAKGRNAYRELFNADCKLLPISQYWKDRLLELGAKPNQLIVHHMGIDLRKFNLARTTHEGKPIKILSASRFVEKKGLEYGILAVSELKKNGYDIEYSIIGGGPLEHKLRGIVKEKNMSDTIKFLGWRTQEELIEQMKQTQIVLLPSVTSSDGDMEGIPVILMEAMAMGKIVLSTFHSGIPELISHGVDGYLVKEKDVQGITDMLKHILKANENWSVIEKKAREKVDQEFNISKLNIDLIDIFKNNSNSSMGD